MNPHDDPRIAGYRRVARTLGAWEGETLPEDAPTSDGAQLALDFAIQEAVKKAPHLDARGLHTRLVWDMRDARSDAYYARLRRERAQERDLTAIAEGGYRAGAAVADIKRKIVAAAKLMHPEPTIETCQAALDIGKWRARWTTK